MEKILEKISSYNLFNYLLSGIAYVVLCKYYTNINLFQDDVVVGIFFYYLIGLVISRIGSLIIESFMRKTKLIVFAPYPEYITASKKDPMIEQLSESNNVYRTLSATFLTVIITKIYMENWTTLNALLPLKWILLVAGLLMFVLAYKKQTEYVVKRIKNNL